MCNESGSFQRAASGAGHTMSPQPTARVSQIGEGTRRWVILGLLSMGMVIANLDRLNLSVVLALDGFRRHVYPTQVGHPGTPEHGDGNCQSRPSEPLGGAGAGRIPAGVPS